MTVQPDERFMTNWTPSLPLPPYVHARMRPPSSLHPSHTYLTISCGTGHPSILLSNSCMSPRSYLHQRRVEEGQGSGCICDSKGGRGRRPCLKGMKRTTGYTAVLPPPPGTLVRGTHTVLWVTHTPRHAAAATACLSVQAFCKAIRRPPKPIAQCLPPSTPVLTVACLS